MTATITDINKAEINKANNAQQTAFALEQRLIMLWVNQMPKMISYCRKEFFMDYTEQLQEPLKFLQERQEELDKLIDGLKGE